MTDFKDDGQESQKKMSFKEHILAELEKANQIRKEKEEELLQQDLKAEELKMKEREAEEARQKTVALYNDYQEEMAKSAENSQDSVHESELETETQSELDANESLLGFEESSISSESGGLETSEIDGSEEFDSQSLSHSESAFESEDSQELEKDSLVASDLSETIPFTPITILNPADIGVALEDDQEAETSESRPSQSLQNEEAHFTSDNDFNHDEAPEASHAVGGLVKKRYSKRQETDRVAKKISMVLISSILAIIVIIALASSLFVYNAVNPVDKKDDKYVQVEIPAGSGNKLIGQVLEENGLIKSGTVFNFYTKFKNFSNFQSGYYNLQKSMSLDEIARALQKGGTDKPTKPVLGKILIPEGYTIKQISKAVTDNSNTKSTKDKTPFKSQDFLNLIQDETFIKEMVKKYPRLLSSLPKKEDAIYQLEGYLFPATYDYYKETDIRSLVDEMLATTDATLSPYYDSIEASGKTVNEVLTLASLVEKEGSTDEDRRDIASVFYNRLQNGMALQSNIAILYAMNKLGDKTTLAEDAAIDTTIKSPYNIYTNTGLMPGPVDSPSLSAIDATVKPANTDYLYFVANVKTGEVFYAKTYEAHSANVEKYVNNQIQ